MPPGGMFDKEKLPLKSSLRSNRSICLLTSALPSNSFPLPIAAARLKDTLLIPLAFMSTDFDASDVVKGLWDVDSERWW